MNRALYRGGSAPLLTPTQLSERLPMPIYLMVSGYVSPFFPSTCRAHPSPAVMVVLNKTLPPSFADNNAGNTFPLYVNGDQWQQVVVPVVNDPRINSWAGKLDAEGDQLKLPVPVYGPGGKDVLPAGTSVGTSAFSTAQPSGLYTNRVAEYLYAVQQLILLKARSI